MSWHFAPIATAARRGIVSIWDLGGCLFPGEIVPRIWFSSPAICVMINIEHTWSVNTLYSFGRSSEDTLSIKAAAA
jgi:hypothetical protein